MLPWFAPVLAQLVTLDVEDRNEARYVVAQDHRYEAATRPGAALSFKWPRYDLSLGYNVSFLVTPLERAPRTLLIFNGAQLDTAYRIQRTTLSLSSFASWGEVNFLVAALQNPNLGVTAPDAANGGATPNQPPLANGGAAPNQPPANGGVPGPATGNPQGPPQTRAVNRVVRYQTSTTTLRLAQQTTRQLRLGAFARYTTAAGLNEASRELYPTTDGTTVGVDGWHTWAIPARDAFVTNGTAQHSWSSNGNLATSLIGNELWTHRFDRHLSTVLGGGLFITRISQTDGLIAYSIFPDASAGWAYQTRLGRGQFTWQTTAYSTPVFDPLRATVDPQVGVRGNVRFSQDRFASSLTGNAGFSVASSESNAGAFDSYQATFLNTFRLTDWAEIDAGARVVQQQFRGGALVPFSYAAFVGLECGYLMTLYGRPPR